MIDMNIDFKSDVRPPKGGWAPGDYFNICKTCGIQFIGAKRSWTCADCAYETKKEVK